MDGTTINIDSSRRYTRSEWQGVHNDESLENKA